jgi:ferredoxin
MVLKGLENCSPRIGIEAERAAEVGFAENERLACQTEITGDVTVEILNPEEVED